MADFSWNDYPVVPAAPVAVQPTAVAPAAAPTAPVAAAAPAAFSWDDHPVVGTAPVAPQAPANAPSGTEALARGTVQGLTLGFGDEAQGGGQALYDKFVGSDGGKSFGDLYSKHLAEARAANEAAQKAHPYLYGGGNLAGGLASGMVTGGLGAETALGRVGAAAAMGAASGVGYGNPDDLRSGAADALKGAVVGGGIGSVAEGVGGVLSGDAGRALKSNAESMAENATGATGAQAMKFQDGAGRELLDRGIVGFGDSQSSIAGKASAALDKSATGISDSLNALDATGAAPIDAQDIISTLQTKINSMKGSPSQAGTVKQLEGILENIKAGPSEYSLNAAEAEKRGFDDLANWKTPEATPANKAAANIYRETVESRAKAIDPTLADKFEGSKADYSLLKPIQEAAERRAATTSQSPWGGMLDLGSAAGAVASGHPLLAPAMAVARRVVAPRLASSAAVGADKLADIVNTAPHLLGPWASQLAAAAARGGSSLGATNFILSQTNPAYREHMKTVFGGDQ